MILRPSMRGFFFYWRSEATQSISHFAAYTFLVLYVLVLLSFFEDSFYLFYICLSSLYSYAGIFWFSANSSKASEFIIQMLAFLATMYYTVLNCKTTGSKRKYTCAPLRVITFTNMTKQAGAELSQAQPKLGLWILLR